MTLRPPAAATAVAELDAPCLWLPGHSAPQSLDACRPPRLRVLTGPNYHRRRTDPVAPPATDRPTAHAPGPTAHAPGERVGGAREGGSAARGHDELHAFAVVALCGW
jgi:hypothetical protein